MTTKEKNTYYHNNMLTGCRKKAGKNAHYFVSLAECVTKAMKHAEKIASNDLSPKADHLYKKYHELSMLTGNLFMCYRNNNPTEARQIQNYILNSIAELHENCKSIAVQKAFIKIMFLLKPIVKIVPKSPI